MKSDAPMLSILCLTYNHERFIAQAIESFFRQHTLFNVEYIIADDCSSDRTVEIVEELSNKFKKEIVILRGHVNVGITRNFRRALQACHGKYIATCEGDDYWQGQQKLQQQVNFLEQNSDYIVAYHDAVIVGNTSLSGQLQLKGFLRSDASNEDLINTRPISTLTACFRNVLGQLPSELDSAPALDLCIWSLLGHYGKGKFMPEIEPACYRVHSEGVFSMQTKEMRLIMSSQSMLALARTYNREGKFRNSEELLAKAAKMLMHSISLRGSLSLLLYILAIILATITRRLSSINAKKALE